LVHRDGGADGDVGAGAGVAGAWWWLEVAGVRSTV
jgi:hypothetical protein